MNNNETNNDIPEKETKKGHHDKHNKEEIQKLNNEITSLNEEVLRCKAELINYRKRKDEEVSSLLRYASSDLITNLLNVKDNFERALNVKEDNLSKDLQTFLSGFRMIYTQFNEILNNEGVKEINPLGEKFDSSKENCLLTENDPSKENDIVTEVISKGYTYHDKIIRCATVKVNVIENNNIEENDNNE